MSVPRAIQWFVQAYQDGPGYLIVDQHDNPIAEDIPRKYHAHIMAAAPAMLDMLKWIVAAYGEEFSSEEQERLRTVIAQAEGKH